MILIGHDMGLTAQVLDRVGVMYAGKLVEVAPIQRAKASLYTSADLLVAIRAREKARGWHPWAATLSAQSAARLPFSPALSDFSLTFYEEEPRITTIAGESGSGKSTLANLALNFIHPTKGQILYKGKNTSTFSRQERFNFRREVQAIFQDPFGTYNPFYKVDTVFETAIDKFKLARHSADARKQIHEALEVVGLRPNEILGKYPHQLSGGQRQRIMVARALVLKPRIIVADEPVSMIDASLQVRILDIFRNLKETFGISFLYITHDLSTAYQISDDIYVLYSGSVAEFGDVDNVIQNPQHPYTQPLVKAIPVPDPSVRWEGRVTSSISELVGSAVGEGCKFYQRCPYAMQRCSVSPPPAYAVDKNQFAACYLHAEQPTIAATI